MYRIVKREIFSPQTFLWELAAPEIARAAQPGQFVIVQLHEASERIPLTLADYDSKRGTITLVVQTVGYSTQEMMQAKEGKSVLNVVGPLGRPSEIHTGKVLFVGGGLGVAPVFPQLRAAKEAGATTLSIIGFRSADYIFWMDRFIQYSDELYVATDDGTFGKKGFVTVWIDSVLEKHPDISTAVVIGPLPMMKAVSDMTRRYGTKTIVSLNTVMVDGTGMCGSCRVTVGGQMRFACVDGPDFDAHTVDFDELFLRARRFQAEEEQAKKKFEDTCRLRPYVE